MIKTEIKELDSLLGGEELQPGNIIIIKGGPGSGKTTLGLQILNNNLKKYSEKGVPNFHAGFISLEVPVTKALEHTRGRYGFNHLFLKKDGDLFYTSKNEIVSAINKHLNPNIAHLDLSQAITDCLNRNRGKNADKFGVNVEKRIIFIDSLNILIDIIQSLMHEKISMRNIMHLICGTATSEVSNYNESNTIFIFSVEHHPSQFENKIFISESFICDIEIILSIEPIKETSLKPKSFISGIGYEIEVDKEGKKAFEYRSFCRVIKSRYSKNDSRRCAYDIKGGKGIVFYDTYPGDGQISLFYDNERQKEVWDEFFKEDIPHHYPALRYEYFERKHLQLSFTNHQRIKFIPDKIDLTLTSFDNYWIHWYSDLWRKFTIRESIESHQAFNEYFNILQDCEKRYDNHHLIDRMTNTIHAVLVKSPILLKHYNLTNKSIDKTEFVYDKYPKMNFIYNYKCSPFEDNIEPNTQFRENQYNPSIFKYHPEVYCINKVTKFFYLNKSGGYEYIDCKSDLYIIGNTQGMIIQFVYNNENKFIFTNNSHIEVEVIDNSEKPDSFKKDLIFDIQNGITYIQKQKHRDIKPNKYFNENNVSKYSLFVLIEGSIFTFKTVGTKSNKFKLSKKLNEIINKFKNDFIDTKVQELFNALSSGNSRKCLECHFLREMLFCFLVKNEEFIEELINTKSENKINLLENNFYKEELISELKKELNAIDKSANDDKEILISNLKDKIKLIENDLKKEILFGLLLELLDDKFINCKYFSPNLDKDQVNSTFLLKQKTLDHIPFTLNSDRSCPPSCLYSYTTGSSSSIQEETRVCSDNQEKKPTIKLSEIIENIKVGNDKNNSPCNWNNAVDNIIDSKTCNIIDTIELKRILQKNLYSMFNVSNWEDDHYKGTKKVNTPETNCLILKLKRIFQLKEKDFDDLFGEKEKNKLEKIEKFRQLLNDIEKKSFDGLFGENSKTKSDKIQYLQEKVIDSLKTVFDGLFGETDKDKNEKRMQFKEILIDAIKINIDNLFIEIDTDLLGKKDTFWKEITTIIRKEFTDIFDDKGRDKPKITELREKLTFTENQVILFLLSFFRQKAEKNMLSSLKNSELRLFGERNSDIIPELKHYDFTCNRPIHHPETIFSMRNFNEFISIPYDANIGFIVYNKGKIEKFYDPKDEDGKNTDVKKKDDNKQKYLNLVKSIYNGKKAALNLLFDFNSQKRKDKKVLPELGNSPDNDKTFKEVTNRSFLFKYPSTWEEIIAICQLMKVESPFLIETQTYDTYLTTFLELLWNSGGDIHTTPDYHIFGDQDKKNLDDHLLHALYLLGLMFYNGIIPENSTLVPREDEFIKEIPWLFSRHWYSTFIELLTAKTKKDEKERLIIEDIGTELALMPIPVTIESYLDKNSMAVKHVSCWGDWHFAVMRGSENMALGAELINKLMSSRDVTERAEKCAHLPTVEAFYTKYGNTRSISIPERKDNDRLPKITYNELRNGYFKHARSRSQIFDYHHYMREIHAVVKYAEHISIRDRKILDRDKRKTPDDITQYPEYLLRDINIKIHQAISNMRKFNTQGFQTH